MSQAAGRAQRNGWRGAPSAIVAERDGLARNALREALTAEGVCVVGQAADTPQVLNLARRCQPDVIVMDTDLPPDGGLAALEAVLPASPGVNVILLAGSGEDDAGLAALAKGAAGYLPREMRLSSLARAVAGVTTGQAAISRAMGRRLIERLRRPSNPTPGMRPIKSPLTTREWEVLDLMTGGASTTDMARELTVSTDTVHSHVHHILRKLHAHSRAEAVEIAAQVRASHTGPAPVLQP